MSSVTRGLRNFGPVLKYTILYKLTFQLELYRRGNTFLEVLATVLIQTAFTSAFGAYSTLIFLTTGSVRFNFIFK